MDVVWKPIPGFPRYSASNTGLVRSEKRLVSTFPDRKGYLKVKVAQDDGRRVGRLVHRLVALAHLGDIPDGLVVCHINGNKTDNAASNLRISTASENEFDKRSHGTAPVGSNHPRSKLTEAEVLEIRAMHAKRTPGRSAAALGRKYGVSGDTVWRIVHRELWAHI